MTWNNITDTLIYDFSDLIKEAKLLKPTKRDVLKILSSFYDPMGLIQSIIMKNFSQIIIVKFYSSPTKARNNTNIRITGCITFISILLSVTNSLKDELLFDNIYHWCDSQIALAWIKLTNKEFKAFIENY